MQTCRPFPNPEGVKTPPAGDERHENPPKAFSLQQGGLFIDKPKTGPTGGTVERYEQPMHESAREFLAQYHTEVVNEVAEAVSAHAVVVVGMAQNPHVKKVRNALAGANIPFEYLEYGSYLSKWRPRLAIKLWSGWPTFPQVFLQGRLVGGCKRTQQALEDGLFHQVLEEARGH